MGASGHVLGPRKLAWLSRRAGLPLDHAVRGYGPCGNDYEGMIRRAGICLHVRIDAQSFASMPFTSSHPYESCRAYLTEER